MAEVRRARCQAHMVDLVTALKNSHRVTPALRDNCELLIAAIGTGVLLIAAIGTGVLPIGRLRLLADNILELRVVYFNAHNNDELVDADRFARCYNAAIEIIHPNFFCRLPIAP